MPHISNKELNTALLGKIFNQLMSVLGNAQNRQILPSVINEFFTKTEKIMFAKRLAIILMIDSNTPQHRIVDLLKVSPSTVARMSLGVEIEKFKLILKVSKKEKIDIEKIVWNIMTVGGIMPPKIGRKYWRKYKKIR